MYEWLQVARGIGSPLCEDHLLATPRIDKVCAKKGGDVYIFRGGYYLRQGGR